MRKVEEHADVAFHASWHEARLTSKEEGWTPPAGVPAEYTPQAVASFKIDEKAHSELVNEFDEAKNPRDARRLLRCAQPHASGFVTRSGPSKEDGDEAHHESSTLPRTAVMYRLGIPLLTDGIPCSLCTQPIYPNGDHATLLRKDRGITSPATTPFATCVANIANQRHALATVLEKQGILGSAPGRRPGDVTIQNWCDGKGLAIDVAVTSPFSAQHPANKSPCESYAEKYKHGKYEKDFKGSDYLILGYCVGNYRRCECRGRGSAAKSDAVASTQLVLRGANGPTCRSASRERLPR